jgi:hypothetical protein
MPNYYLSNFSKVTQMRHLPQNVTFEGNPRKVELAQVLRHINNLANKCEIKCDTVKKFIHYSQLCPFEKRVLCF